MAAPGSTNTWKVGNEQSDVVGEEQERSDFLGHSVAFDLDDHRIKEMVALLLGHRSPASREVGPLTGREFPRVGCPPEGSKRVDPRLGRQIPSCLAEKAGRERRGPTPVDPLLCGPERGAGHAPVIVSSQE